MLKTDNSNFDKLENLKALFKLAKGKFLSPVKTPDLSTITVNCLYALESVGINFAEPLCLQLKWKIV